ncbi:hypothetical protein [Kitasatospora sp. NPDC088548]|uniref:hypothetical protein n=1 Tax=Kitasatospora sp. NPDC088548 TaxID=3364075 RepID=UPI0038142761
MLSFAQAAERLAKEGVVRSMTAEGLRKLARTDPEWTLTEQDYGAVGNARTVPYELVLEYFTNRTKRRGRGPAKPAAGSPG